MIANRARIAGSETSLLPAVKSLARVIAPYALLAGIGIELALLTAFLPETLDRFLHGPPADFHNLYRVAHNRDVPGLYSPFLVVLLYPLAQLPEMVAFRVFFLINTACVVGVALVAQNAVRSFEAKTLVALAPFALPQMHWAVRLGHLTPVLALVALLALVLLRTHPKRAAVLIGFLSLKPQYVIAPMAYLVWRKQFRLVAVVCATGIGLAALGFIVIGPGGVSQFVSYYLDWGPNSTDNLLPVQQSWMVSWTGVQISLGREANPLITLDLIALSLGIAMFAWARLDTAGSLAVVALMFIPLTPYAQFYDAALVIVAIALLLRTDLPDGTKAALCGALYLAAIVTQANINFPIKDVLGPASTQGFYWIAPVLAAAVGLLAIIGKPQPAADEAPVW